MSGLEWCHLARATLAFIAKAKRAHFCEDFLAEIERRLFLESPFPSHHKKN